MDTRVVVLGGGMAGLMAAQAFKSTSRQITIIERGSPGGAFASGGFKYLHATERMRDLMSSLQLDWHEVPVIGGIMIDGKVEPYPEHLTQALSEPQALAIMRKHYDKTRGDGQFTKTAMNDPWGPKPSHLVTDMDQLIKRCMSDVRWARGTVKAIEQGDHEVVTDTCGRIKFDILINTLPLWVFSNLVKLELGDYFDEPVQFIRKHAKATTVSVLRCLSLGQSVARFDYVYTPVTPGDMIHRVSKGASWFDCETTKPLDSLGRLFSDIRFILGDAHVVGGVTLFGHVKHVDGLLDAVGALPRNWLMVGRFAQWDGRCTVDKAYQRAVDLSREIDEGKRPLDWSQD